MEHAAGRVNQKLRTRTAIVQAAAELGSTGREVTMPEVARVALVSEATAYRYFPDLASLLGEVIADLLPDTADAVALVVDGDADDPVARVAAVTEFLLRHVLSRQGVVRTLIAASITRPGQPHARPGVRFELIEYALAPFGGDAGDGASGDSSTLEPALERAQVEALAQLKRDLAVVVSAEALFSLIDLHGLEPEQAIASIVHTATTLTRAELGM